jgi:hypothetical protein
VRNASFALSDSLQTVSDVGDVCVTSNRAPDFVLKEFFVTNAYHG